MKYILIILLMIFSTACENKCKDHSSIRWFKNGEKVIHIITNEEVRVVEVLEGNTHVCPRYGEYKIRFSDGGEIYSWGKDLESKFIL